MIPSVQHLVGRFLLTTKLAWMPLRARRGFLAGCWWSVYPFSSYWRGTHEPAVQAVLMGLGDIRGWTCWDLGAHYGFYSVGLARRVGPDGEVAAFEPNPLSCRRLAYHRRLNRFSWLKIFAVAASDHNGQIELYTYGELTSTTTHLAYEGETRVDACAPLVVPAVKLDDLVTVGTLRPPDLVKIDVEGHGHRSLAGMSDVMRRQRPHVLAALHSQPEESGMLKILEPLGYKPTLVGASPAPRGSWVGREIFFRRPN